MFKASLVAFALFFSAQAFAFEGVALRREFAVEQLTWDTKVDSMLLCAKFKTQLQAGDLIFLAIDNFLFRRVAESTLTWTSHVGLVLPDESGKLMVYESKLPFSKKTEICAFAGRTGGGKIAVRRYQGHLSASDVERMRTEANARMGRLYDTGFNMDSPRMFCSRFIYEVYRTAIGVEVGEVETFRQLLSKNNDPSLVKFWKVWFFGSVPWERRTVTPASQMIDPKFTTIFSNGI